MATENTFDLIVIGGGPAGTSAAITAARTGANVLLLEAGRLPRHKVCGEFVSAESLALLTSLLAPHAERLLDPAPRISQSRLFLDGRIVSTPVNPPAASLARLDLDFALLKSAEAQGVTVRSQTAAQSISEDKLSASSFRVATTAGEFTARAVINASGRWSRLNPVSSSKPGARWIGLKAHFSEPAPSDSVDLYFFDGGYCGVQPVRLLDDDNPHRINACAMVKAETASTLAEVFALHPALRERSANWRPLSDPVSTSPLVFRAPHPESGGVLLAGDAATFVDPFVGDGISLALRSGALAAECLIPFLRGHTPLDAAVRQYAGAYRKRFASVFNTSSKIRRMLLLPRPVRKAALSVLQHTPAVTSYLVEKTR